MGCDKVTGQNNLKRQVKRMKEKDAARKAEQGYFARAVHVSYAAKNVIFAYCI